MTHRDERLQQQTQASPRKHDHIRIPSPPQPLFPWKEVCQIPYNSFKLKHKIKLKIDTNYKVQILSRFPLALHTYRPGILKFIMVIVTLDPESQLDSDTHTNHPCYLPKQELYFCQPQMFRTPVSPTHPSSIVRMSL